MVGLLRHRHLRDDARAVHRVPRPLRSRPGGRLYPICTSADSLPLEDDSIDLAITSAVFLHMGKSFVKRAVARDRAHSQARRRLRLRRLVPELVQPAEFPAAPEAAAIPAPALPQVLDARRGRGAPGRVRTRRESGRLQDRGRRPLDPAEADRHEAAAADATRQSGRQRAPKRFDDVLAETYLAYSPGCHVRALVTGGGGFLGSHLVERLEARRPRRLRSAPPRLRPDDDGRGGAPLRRRAPGARLPPRGRGRRDRREPRQPRPLLVREPDDGRARARAVAGCTRSRSS